MAIIGVTAVVLLNQRMEVVRDAARARDLRTAWVLVSQKLAELELDKTLWAGVGSSGNGDFADVDPDYALYQWEYQIVREPIDISDPLDPQADKKPKEILRLTLGVRAPSIEDPLIVEAEFAIAEPKPVAPPGGDAKEPPTGAQPPPGTGAPRGDGKK